MKKAKWLPEEALQIVLKRREVKSKGEKERYSHLNAEFQRIARREKNNQFSNNQRNKQQQQKQSTNNLYFFNREKQQNGNDYRSRI